MPHPFLKESFSEIANFKPPHTPPKFSPARPGPKNDGFFQGSDPFVKKGPVKIFSRGKVAVKLHWGNII